MGISRKSEADELEAREQIRQLALRASAKQLDRLAERIRYTPWGTPRDSSALEDVIDNLAFTIADLNNWKGVLQWLDDNE